MLGSTLSAEQEELLCQNFGQVVLLFGGELAFKGLLALRVGDVVGAEFVLSPSVAGAAGARRGPCSGPRLREGSIRPH